MAEPDEDKKYKDLSRLVAKTEYKFSKTNTPNISEPKKNFLGKCGRCKNLMFAESEFNILFAKCSAFEVEVHKKEPIINCSAFQEIGSMTLWDMQQCAILIDLDKKTVGFIIQENFCVAY